MPEAQTLQELHDGVRQIVAQYRLQDVPSFYRYLDRALELRDLIDSRAEVWEVLRCYYRTSTFEKSFPKDIPDALVAVKLAELVAFSDAS
jgi:hypothetical protein